MVVGYHHLRKPPYITYISLPSNSLIPASEWKHFWKAASTSLGSWPWRIPERVQICKTSFIVASCVVMLSTHSKCMEPQKLRATQQLCKENVDPSRYKLDSSKPLTFHPRASTKTRCRAYLAISGFNLPGMVCGSTVNKGRKAASKMALWLSIQSFRSEPIFDSMLCRISSSQCLA